MGLVWLLGTSVQWIEAKTRSYYGIVSSEFAEAMAVKEALSWIKQKNWTIIVLESDSLFVVQAIPSIVPMLSPYGRIIETCQREIRTMNKICLYFIKQCAIMMIHHFAMISYKL